MQYHEMIIHRWSAKFILADLFAIDIFFFFLLELKKMGTSELTTISNNLLYSSSLFRRVSHCLTLLYYISHFNILLTSDYLWFE